MGEKKQIDLGPIMAAEAELREHQERMFLEPRWTTGEIMAGLGVPEVTLRSWLTRGNIDVAGGETRAKGKHRLFSIRDALVIATAYRLNRIGVPVSTFAHVYYYVLDVMHRYMRGAVGMAPMKGVLSNDGDAWHFEPLISAGPSRISDDKWPAVGIVIDAEKIVVETLAAMGLSVMIGTAADYERALSREAEG